MKARGSCMTWICMGEAAVMKAKTLKFTGAYQKRTYWSRQLKCGSGWTIMNDVLGILIPLA